MCPRVLKLRSRGVRTLPMVSTRHLLTTVFVLLAFAALSGCGGPCDELADIGCENAGEESPSCLRLRERSEKVSRADRRACSVALSLVEALEKAR